MNVIVAVDENWGIGKDGDQLVYLSQDLKRFKALTTGHPVILGRKTLATFPGGRPLKGRRNLIRPLPRRVLRYFGIWRRCGPLYRRTPLLSAAPRYTSSCCPGAIRRTSPGSTPPFRRTSCSPIWTGIPIGNWRRRSRPWSRMACSSTMCATGGYVDGRPGEWGDIITMSGETCFRKNTVRPAFVDAGRTVFQNMACFLRFSSASGRFDRIAPTVG